MMIQMKNHGWIPSLNGCCGESGDRFMKSIKTIGNSSKLKKLYKLHVAFPQTEFHIPTHVIERFAREVQDMDRSL